MLKRLRLAVLALLAIAFSSCQYLSSSRNAGKPVRASGTIEATTVDVSFQVGGRVTEILAREGQNVKTGEALARLSGDESEARVRQAEAALDGVTSQIRQQEAAVQQRESMVDSQIKQARGQAQAARAALERLRHGSRPEEIRVAEAEVAQAEAALDSRKPELQRATELFQQGLVSQERFDTAKAALRTAEAAANAARQQLALVREGPRREDIAEGEARLLTAEAAVSAAEATRKEIDIQRESLRQARSRQRELAALADAARLQQGYTEIRAPIDGVVLTKNVEAGEFVNPGSAVVTIANLKELWINLYVPETQTGRIRLGQTAHIQVDSFPKEQFTGKVIFISSESEFTPKTIQTEEERIKLVYRVKVALDDSGQRLKPGMPADAELVE
jgi:HlyD family secretion protein